MKTSTLREHLDDFHVYGGIALVATGAGLVYFPAALIVAGLALLLIGFAAVLPRKEPS